MTRKQFTTFLIAGLGLILFSAAAIAHHSIEAEFDRSQPIQFTGKVVRVDWGNPHIYTHVQVENPDGTVVVYKVEGGAPNPLFRSGWRADSLAIGEVVSFTGIRAKSAASMNVNGNMTRADGSRAFAGNGPAAD